MRNFEVKFKLNNWPSFALHYDTNYGIDRRKGWSCAIDGSFYVELVSNPLAAVWTAITKHRAAVRDLAKSEEYDRAGGAGQHWDRAEEYHKRIVKEAADWRAAFATFRLMGSSGSIYLDDLIRQYDDAVTTAKILRDEYHGK